MKEFCLLELHQCWRGGGGGKVLCFLKQSPHKNLMKQHPQSAPFYRMGRDASFLGRGGAKQRVTPQSHFLLGTGNDIRNRHDALAILQIFMVKARAAGSVTAISDFYFIFKSDF